MSAIPERIWALLTPVEREELEAVVDGWRFRPTTRCPKCDAEIQVRLKITASAVMNEPESDKTPPKYILERSSVDQRVIEAARTSGLLDAFSSAVRAEKEHSGIPSDIDEFFLSFWKNAQPMRVNAVVLAGWINEFGGHIDVWGVQGIVAVMSDGELVAFVPNRLTVPVAITGVGNRPKLSNAAGLELWTKSKFGYVPMSARGFGEALRQKNIGKFGAVVQ